MRKRGGKDESREGDRIPLDGEKIVREREGTELRTTLIRQERVYLFLLMEFSGTKVCSILSIPILDDSMVLTPPV